VIVYKEEGSQTSSTLDRKSTDPEIYESAVFNLLPKWFPRFKEDLIVNTWNEHMDEFLTILDQKPLRKTDPRIETKKRPREKFHPSTQPWRIEGLIAKLRALELAKSRNDRT
jgi:hypothetical protein